MSLGKEAYSRYIAIDYCLRRKKGATLEEIVEYVAEKIHRKIGVRTIQQDLQMMRYDQSLGFDAPIVFSRSTRKYSYTEKNYSIQRMPLSADDLNGIDFAISILSQFKQIPIIKEFEEAIQRIASSVKLNREAMGEERFIYFSTTENYKGIEFIEKISAAIRKKKIVAINYRSFEKEKTKTHRLEPIFIREFKGRFYLIGISRAKGDAKLLTFSFDRIIDAMETDEDFNAIAIDKKDFYKHAIGVTVTDQSPEKVVLDFTPVQGAYILSQPLHSSQKLLKSTKEKTTIALDVQINKELIMLLLSYGNSVTIKSPDSLRKQLKEELKKAINNYK